MREITERDKDIFRILSSGPATFPYLKHSLNLMRKESQKTSDMALRRRLSQLVKEKYIASRKYGMGDIRSMRTLYAVTPMSVEVLTGMGYAVERIRAGLPGKPFVTHELAVTDVVRRIKREGAELKFEYVFTDERTLRQMSKGLRRRKLYPDLFVKLSWSEGSEKKRLTLNIEVDNSTILARYVIGKVKRMAFPTLILCMTRDRIEILKKASELEWKGMSEKEKDAFYRKIFFGLISDFTGRQGGFAGTNWETFKGENAYIIGG